MAASTAPRLPTGTPPFTVKQLKDAIPAHCFERNTLTSLRYTFVDLAAAATLYWLSTFIEHPAVPEALQYALWPLYWVVQGFICTGLWVIAHECGHRAFSDNIFFGDCVGWLLHSALLVPYHSWRISHAKHHRSTNDMERDEVFIPPTESEMGGHVRGFDEMPIIVSVVLRLVQIFKFLVFGWPAYLLTHATGRKYEKPTNHFNPNAPLFADSERMSVVISDIGILTTLGVLGYLGTNFGWLWLFKVYGVPYLFVNMWLVLITDLQHTDPSIPHYRGEQWSWLKGALCTLDRDYGFLNVLFHHIGDTHVTHHLFSHIPHYHAEEATAALRKVLGEYYLQDTVAPGLRGIAQALWKTTTYCRFVDDVGDILWFRHASRAKAE